MYNIKYVDNFFRSLVRKIYSYIFSVNQRENSLVFLLVLQKKNGWNRGWLALFLLQGILKMTNTLGLGQRGCPASST